MGASLGCASGQSGLESVRADLDSAAMEDAFHAEVGEPAEVSQEPVAEQAAGSSAEQAKQPAAAAAAAEEPAPVPEEQDILEFKQASQPASERPGIAF